jgi:aminopeptidase N
LALLTDLCRDILQDPELDRAYVARLLSLPSEKYLLQQMSPMDPRALSKARQTLEANLGAELQDVLVALIHQLKPLPTYEPSAKDAGQRALRNHALSWLCQAGLPSGQSLANDQYAAANNMTDRLGALRGMLLLAQRDAAIEQALNDFYTTFKADPLVVDKWFSLQATAPNMTVQAVRSLMQHEAFEARNPNRLRALIFQFCLNNPMGFHTPDGEGYRFWAEQVKSTDQTNPEVAARLARTLDHWTHHAEPYKSHMREALVSVSQTLDLSGNTKEIISKALTL